VGDAVEEVVELDEGATAALGDVPEAELEDEEAALDDRDVAELEEVVRVDEAAALEDAAVLEGAAELEEDERAAELDNGDAAGLLGAGGETTELEEGEAAGLESAAGLEDGI
jgi:hypothetical protein